MTSGFRENRLCHSMPPRASIFQKAYLSIFDHIIMVSETKNADEYSKEKITY